MPSKCVFQFDRPEPVYYSGETINGRIILNTTSEKSCHEVYIRFHGYAKTDWTENIGGKRVYHCAEENYIESRTAVCGEGTLPIGEHIYTFNIPLPIECPSSCVEKYGQIKYTISLIIDRKLRFNNEFKQSITVLKQFNLNFSPELLVPLQAEEISNFCCFPCSSGPVVSSLIIPFGGYAPGQSIEYSLTIDNKSSKYDISGIEVELRQTYNFSSTFPRRKTRTRAVTLTAVSQKEEVMRLSKRVLQGELTIPSVPPTSSDSGIITVNYDILVTIKRGTYHKDSKITSPIKIGTVPLVQSAKTPLSQEDLPQSYDLIKPSSFEETTVKTHFVDADGGGERFIPRYPMYSNFVHPTAPQIHAAENKLT